MEAEIDVRDGDKVSRSSAVLLSWALASARPWSAAGVGELEGVHELHTAVFGKRFGGIGGDGERVLPLVRVAVAVDLALIAAQDVVATELDHLLVGVDCVRGLVFFAVDDAEPIEEDGTVALFGIGVLQRSDGSVQDGLKGGTRLIVFAERVVEHGFVEGELEVAGGVCGKSLALLRVARASS